MKVNYPFKYYFLAVNDVLDGIFVKDLELIRLGTDAFLRAFNKNKRLESILNSKELILTYKFADAENRILVGENPDKIYSPYPMGVSPNEHRRIIRNYLKEQVINNLAI